MRQALLALVTLGSLSCLANDLDTCASRLAHVGYELRPLVSADLDLVARSLSEPTPSFSWRDTFRRSRSGAIVLLGDVLVGVAIAERITNGLHLRRLQVAKGSGADEWPILHGLVSQMEEAVSSTEVLAVTVSEFAEAQISVLEARGYEKFQTIDSTAGEMWVFSKQMGYEPGEATIQPLALPYYPSPTVRISIDPGIEAGDYEISRLPPRRQNAAWTIINDYERTYRLPPPVRAQAIEVIVRLSGTSDSAVAAVMLVESLPNGELRVRVLRGDVQQRDVLFRNLLRKAMTEGRDLSALCGRNDVEGLAYLQAKGFRLGSDSILRFDMSKVSPAR